MTLLPWEYLWLPFSRSQFPDIYDPIWISSLALLAVLVVLYNVRTRALHRHRLYTDMWEWLLWTGLVTFFLLATGALFLFDFAIVLVIGLAGNRDDGLGPVPPLPAAVRGVRAAACPAALPEPRQGRAARGDDPLQGLAPQAALTAGGVSGGPTSVRCRSRSAGSGWATGALRGRPARTG